MTYTVQKLSPNVLGVDTLATLTPLIFRTLVESGYRFRAGYLDHLSPLEVQQQLAAGLPLLPLTYANELDVAHLLDRIALLGLPVGTHIVFDVEEVSLPPDELIVKINEDGRDLLNHGYFPTLYDGAGGKLTSDELSGLEVFRYWCGCSDVRDRAQKPAQPSRGYAMFQGRPFDVQIPGCGDVKFDIDFHREDFRGDVFSVVVQAP